MIQQIHLSSICLSLLLSDLEASTLRTVLQKWERGKNHYIDNKGILGATFNFSQNAARVSFLHTARDTYSKKYSRDVYRIMKDKKRSLQKREACPTTNEDFWYLSYISEIWYILNSKMLDFLNQHKKKKEQRLFKNKWGWIISFQHTCQLQYVLGNTKKMNK